MERGTDISWNVDIPDSNGEREPYQISISTPAQSAHQYTPLTSKVGQCTTYLTPKEQNRLWPTAFLAKIAEKAGKQQGTTLGLKRMNS